MSEILDGLPLYAIVPYDGATDIPAMFTSEGDADRFCAELPDNENGDRYTVVEVVVMHNYYAGIDDPNGEDYDD